MPKIDVVLQAQGDRWRAEVDARFSRASFVPGPTRRGAAHRAVSWTIALTATAAIIAGIAVADQMRGHHGGALTAPTSAGVGAGHSQASCVAPFLRADPRRSPPPPRHPTSLGNVRPGQSITVYGWWYYRGPCIDEVQIGQTIPRATPADTVALLLTTADGKTATLTDAQPRGGDASFNAKVNIPDDAPPGPATIRDELGDTITLSITGR